MLIISTVEPSKKNGARSGGGVSESPEEQFVSSADVPSGHVALPRLVTDKLVSEGVVIPNDSMTPDPPNAPVKLAPLKFVPSSEPPMKFKMMVFERLAFDKSAPSRLVSISNDWAKFAPSRFAPDRLEPEKSTAPKSRPLRSCPDKLRFDQSPSRSEGIAPNKAITSGWSVPPVVKLNESFSQTKAISSDCESVGFRRTSSRRFSSPRPEPAISNEYAASSPAVKPPLR